MKGSLSVHMKLSEGMKYSTFSATLNSLVGCIKIVSDFVHSPKPHVGDEANSATIKIVSLHMINRSGDILYLMRD
jgi:hypothetical protein